MIKVMLISKSTDVLNDLQYLINDEELGVVAKATDPTMALDQIENTQPDLLVVHMDGNDFNYLQLLERMIQFRPRTFPILIQDDMTVDNIKAANAIGVHNIIAMPTDEADFCQYLHMVYMAEQGRIDALKEKQTVTWSSKIITVYGAKEGLGKTTLACNLAVYLASKRKKVALLDLDLQFGDVCLYLDIEPKETIGEMMQDGSVNDVDTIQTYMTIHSSGVHVLAAPKSPEYAEIVSADQVSRILAMLRTYYDFVIIDCAANLNDVTLTAIESSTKILMVAAHDLGVLKNSKMAVSLIKSLNQKDKLRVVLNKVTDTKTITMDDVGKVLNAPIMMTIPCDTKVATAAMNQGQPFINNTKSKMTAAIIELAEVLMMDKENFNLLEMSNKERRSYVKKNKVKEESDKKFVFGRLRGSAA